MMWWDSHKTLAKKINRVRARIEKGAGKRGDLRTLFKLEVRNLKKAPFMQSAYDRLDEVLYGMKEDQLTSKQKARVKAAEAGYIKDIHTLFAAIGNRQPNSRDLASYDGLFQYLSLSRRPDLDEAAHFPSAYDHFGPRVKLGYMARPA